MEKSINKAFRILFLFLAIMALGVILNGAYHHVATLVLCLIMQGFRIIPKKVKA